MIWFMTFIALVGLYFNLRGKWEGFLLWLISNAYWCVHNCFIGEIAQALLFAVFWGLSLVGLCLWRKKITMDDREARQRDLIRFRTVLLCRDIIDTEKRLQQRPGRIKINGMLNDARDILELLDCENGQTNNINS